LSENYKVKINLEILCLKKLAGDLCVKRTKMSDILNIIIIKVLIKMIIYDKTYMKTTIILK